MTESDVSADLVGPTPQLTGIYLYECQVERGEGDKERPGEVLWEQGIQTDVQLNVVRYLVSSTAELADVDGKSIANIALSFVAAYSCEGELSERQATDFARSVVMHVTPYQREFLSSLTTRMAIPTFVLPLVRLGEFELTTDDEDSSPREAVES
jgi:hypothetical protein